MSNTEQKKQEKALEILADKDPAFDADIANTNERLAASANTDADFVKASLNANNPVGSTVAYRDPKEEKKLDDRRERDAARDQK